MFQQFFNFENQNHQRATGLIYHSFVEILLWIYIFEELKYTNEKLRSLLHSKPSLFPAFSFL